MNEDTEALLTLVLALAPERGPWRIWGNGSIRNSDRECPICAMVNVVTGSTYRIAAGFAMQDLTGVVETGGATRGIVDAADGLSYGAPEIRKALLEGLGIA